MTQIMYDSTNANGLPEGGAAYAGYVDGYASFPEIVNRFGHKAHLLSITINAGVLAACLDIESGAATIGDARYWVDRALAADIWRPCVYATADSYFHQGLLQDLSGYGDRIRRWVAWWTDTEDIPGGFDAKQFASNNAYDTSDFRPSMFPQAAPPKPVDPHHYEWFFTGPFRVSGGKSLNERHIVIEYDVARQHWIREHNTLKALRSDLKALAARVYEEAVIVHPLKDGKPSWDLFHRGWRYQELIQRANGKRFV